jgi:amino acid adenylation domain-containing protein
MAKLLRLSCLLSGRSVVYKLIENFDVGRSMTKIKMNEFNPNSTTLPPEQESIRVKCFHPSGTFVEFKKEEIEQSISSRFEGQVHSNSDRLAVRTRSHELTYDALNRAGNRVARAIMERRGTGEEPVALLFEQGAPVIASILGVLKAGKFYVPLDSSYPQTRTRYMLEDSAADLIVTNTQNLSLARDLVRNGGEVLNFDTLDPTLSDENLELCVAPANLAYMIYTSGSTGQPKGVVQSHRNVLHDIMNYTNALHICKHDRLITLTSYSFADTARSTYGALLNGASLYPLDIREDGLTHLAEWLIQQEITIYRSVPTTFRHFIRTLDGKEQFPKLRLVYMAGEPVHKRDVELYKRHFSSNCIFMNGIGSTECLTYRWYFINKETTINGNNVPVGYALVDMEILLLDDDGNEMGPNQIGEMAVKSRYLCPGYWRKPELTRAVFLSPPESGEGRIYRTGDLGLMLADGCLIHMGRKDFQVKIRGHRVEVAEIEAKLLSSGKVKEAIVILREDRPGDQRLVAYFVPAERPIPTVTTLRRALAEKLPDYMIPSAFVSLDALPLLPNGKIDRRQLPTPDRTRADLATPFLPPQTRVEEALTDIWAEVLVLDRVGIHDNFLELGGNSLLATQIISRVISILQVEIPLRSLFESPTVADMAMVVTQNQIKKAEQKDIERMLEELERLSDNAAKQSLSTEGAGSDKKQL